MSVRAGAHRQVVLARKAERLVVVGLEEQAGVVDLEDVDVRQMAVEGGGVRDRVQAVEGVGDVDEAALLLDRLDRVREGHALRNLLREEEPDHLALAVGLHLFARNHGQVAVARELDRLERAAEHVVVGDCDRAEPDRLGLIEHVLDLDRAIARPRGVQVEVDEDPLPVGERLIRLARVPLRRRREARVELLEVGRDVGEGLALDASSRLLGELAAQRLVLGQPRERRGGELGLLVHAGRRGDRGARGGRLERDAGEAVERGDEDRGLVEDRSAASPVAGRAHARPAAQLRRDRRPPRQRFRPQEDELPVGQLAQRADDGSPERSLRRPPLEDDELSLRRPAERAPCRRPPRRSGIPGEALRGRVAASGEAATSASVRVSSRSRCALPGG